MQISIFSFRLLVVFLLHSQIKQRDDNLWNNLDFISSDTNEKSTPVSSSSTSNLNILNDEPKVYTVGDDGELILLEEPHSEAINDEIITSGSDNLLDATNGKKAKTDGKAGDITNLGIVQEGDH